MKTHYLLLFSLILGYYQTPVNACTRVLAKSHEAILVGRNMDWGDDPKTNLIVYPRGSEHYGSDEKNNRLYWQSHYGSIVATAYDDLTTDGFNEAGLAAHILWLNESDYGTRDASKPALSVSMWNQFYLDNFATVAEAVAFTEKEDIQLLPYFQANVQQWVRLHLVLEDASGDSAIIEYIQGHPHIYHDKKYKVVTNSPTYEQQLINLENYLGFGGDKPLPGTNDARDRFVRASFYVQACTASDNDCALMSVLSILNNAAQPLLGITQRSQTLWHSVSDLTRKIYYYQSTGTQNILIVDLQQFSLQSGEPARKLDLVHHPEYSGHVETEFIPLS